TFYEQTKFEAELLVRRAMGQLPCTVLRPAFIVGDSRTGEIDRFDGPYIVAGLLLSTRLQVPLPLPGDGVAPLNVVPIDFVAATLGDASAKTPEVSTQELRQVLAGKSATVLDSRPRAEYAVSHIPGALNVAATPGLAASAYVSDVAEVGRLLQDRKQTPLVLYCNGPFCGKSKRLSEELAAAGYTSVRRYQLGIPVWRALGGV